MRLDGGDKSLLFNNFFVYSIFPTLLPPETSIGKGCFIDTSILYSGLYVNDMLKVALLLI